MTLKPDKQSLLDAFARLLKAQQEFEDLGGKEMLGAIQEATQKPEKEASKPTNPLFGQKQVAKIDAVSLEKSKPSKKIQSTTVSVEGNYIAPTLEAYYEEGWRVVNSCHNNSRTTHVFLEREV